MTSDEQVNQIPDEETRNRIRALLDLAVEKNIAIVVCLDDGQTAITLGFANLESVNFLGTAWDRDRCLAHYNDGSFKLRNGRTEGN